MHCTHGYNRTGFMIIAFLCEALDFQTEAALQLFKQARPPGMYKCVCLCVSVCGYVHVCVCVCVRVCV